MKVAVIGSRGLTVAHLEHYLPHRTTEIVSGGAVGVDDSAAEYAKKANIPLKVFEPDYLTYGKKAPLYRNLEIVRYADQVLAFWDGHSRGTRFVIDNCRRMHTPVDVFLLEDFGDVSRQKEQDEDGEEWESEELLPEGSFQGGEDDWPPENAESFFAAPLEKGVGAGNPSKEVEEEKKSAFPSGQASANDASPEKDAEDDLPFGQTCVEDEDGKDNGEEEEKEAEMLFPNEENLSDFPPDFSMEPPPELSLDLSLLEIGGEEGAAAFPNEAFLPGGLPEEIPPPEETLFFPSGEDDFQEDAPWPPDVVPSEEKTPNEEA